MRIRRRFHYLAVLFLALGASNPDPRLLAQAPPRPNVTIASRVPSLTVQVFPADFNKDGRTDLVASSTGGSGWAGALEVRYGNGDGTFGSAIRPAVPPMVPLGVGDFNNDARTDILAYQVIAHSDAPAEESIVVVPGTAGGFGTPVHVDAPRMVGEFFVAAIADFDRDGARDFAYAGIDDNLYVFPGRGDLTFDPARTVPGLFLSRGAVAADLNGDLLPDLAVTADYGRRVDVFLNQGAFVFATSTIPLDGSGLGVTAWDVDGDGDRDLIAGSGNFQYAPYQWEDGAINVMLGDGHGSFAPPVKFPTLPGPVGVVAGDFNRDGLIDIATANQSNPHDPRCDGSGTKGSSVSILTGAGNGRFGAAVSFALDYITIGNPYGSPYREVGPLRTSDVNGDGRTDLITTPAAVLLNAAAAANRAPVANAGPDVQNIPPYDVVLQGSATDPDSDWLTYEWTDESGRVVGDQPFTCLKESYTAPSQTFTLTVTDARGGVSTDRMNAQFENSDADAPTASVYRPAGAEQVQLGARYTLRFGAASSVDVIERFDLDFSPDGGDTWMPIEECTAVPGDLTSCTWINPSPLTTRGAIRVRAIDRSGRQGFGTSGLFAIVADATEPDGLPAGWIHNDVGSVAAAGSASYSSGVFTVKGSGADIWGTSDEFHYVSQMGYGDFSITARVVSVQNVDQWTKAGLMIRTSAWNRGGNASHASVFATPTTVKGLAFQRRTTAGGPSTHTAGPALTAPVWLKLTKIDQHVVSYYKKNLTDAWTEIDADDIALGEQVAVGLAVTSHADGRVATATFDNVQIEPLHAFQTSDIGAVGVTGRTPRDTHDGVGLTLEGSGADIWGSADAFRFHSTRWFGDGTLTVRVRSVEQTHAWAKAGIMFRESATPGSRHVFAFASAGKGLSLQYRSESGQASAQAANLPGTAPEWIRLTRRANVFSAETSDDGVHWQALGSIEVTMASEIVAGVAVTSHDNTTLATAELEEVRLGP